MPKQAYIENLRQYFLSLIEVLELPDLQKAYLRARWLDQVLWLGLRVSSVRTSYNALRLTAIIGGLTVSALTTLNIGVNPASQVLQYVVVVLGLVVSISVALEDFFHFGDRHRHYSQSFEILQTEGWNFFQLSGAYRRYPDHMSAYRTFVTRSEAIIQRGIEAILSVEEEAKKEKTAGDKK